MAKVKKTKKAVARKRKTKATPRNIITEYDGWSAGDMIWTVPFGENKPFQGEIDSFHPTDAIEPSVSYIEILSRKYRVARMSLIAEDKAEAKALWAKFCTKKKTKK
jgi:hypothetical protein